MLPSSQRYETLEAIAAASVEAGPALSAAPSGALEQAATARAARMHGAIARMGSVLLARGRPIFSPKAWAAGVGPPRAPAPGQARPRGRRRARRNARARSRCARARDPGRT